MTVIVFGAAGRTGRHVVPLLCDTGRRVVACGRDAATLDTLDRRAGRLVVDLDGDDAIAADAIDCVVSLAPAKYTEKLLAAFPDPATRFVLAGSTRRFSRLPDAKADEVRGAESAFAAARRRGLFLHPSLIYGAPGETTINRVFDRLEGWPRALPAPLPLPDGGRHLVQPVHYLDVAAAFAAAAERDDADGTAIVLAGPAPVAYAELVRAVARRVGRRVTVVPVPTVPLALAMDALARLRLPAPLAGDEVRRAAEDKRFDPRPMAEALGVAPRTLDDGLDEIWARRRPRGAP